MCVSREHLSEEDLRKNKAMLEGLTKGQLVDNPEVTFNAVFCYQLCMSALGMFNAIHSQHGPEQPVVSHAHCFNH